MLLLSLLITSMSDLPPLIISFFLKGTDSVCNSSSFSLPFWVVMNFSFPCYPWEFTWCVGSLFQIIHRVSRTLFLLRGPAVLLWSIWKWISFIVFLLAIIWAFLLRVLPSLILEITLSSFFSTISFHLAIASCRELPLSFLGLLPMFMVPIASSSRRQNS